MPLPGLENPSAPSEDSVTSNHIENHFKQRSWCVVTEELFSFCSKEKKYYENISDTYSVPVASWFSQEQNFLEGKNNHRIIGTFA